MTIANSRRDDLQDFYDRVQRFDWFHEMSDDNSVFLAREAAWAKLKSEAAIDSDKTDILIGFRKHHYSGKAFGTEKQPVPPRPIH